MNSLFPDKYKLTKDQNRRFARSNLTNLVHTTARFEGVNTTLPQTQTIIDGLSVAGVSTQDIITIVNLKRGWQFITESELNLSLSFEKQINKIVAANDSLDPGEFRTGNGQVILNDTDYFDPPMVNVSYEKNFLSDISNDKHASITQKAMTIMYHNMRQQIFWDGNKRTAILIANKLMIDNGAGLINIPLDKWETWNTLISKFYQNNDMTNLLQWTYDNGIQGVSL